MKKLFNKILSKYNKLKNQNCEHGKIHHFSKRYGHEITTCEWCYGSEKNTIKFCFRIFKRT